MAVTEGRQASCRLHLPTAVAFCNSRALLRRRLQSGAGAQIVSGWGPRCFGRLLQRAHCCVDCNDPAPGSGRLQILVAPAQLRGFSPAGSH
jgi:hypothetical protein